MAIVWSAASGGMYIGIEAWVVSGPHADGKVIIHVDYYLEAESGYAHHWTYPWHWSGTGGSGSQQVRYDSSHASTPRVKLPGWDVAVWSEFGRATTATFNASLGPIWNGGAPSVSATVSVPARPYLVPAAPSSVSVSRVSDTQATVAFAVASSGSAPVQSIGIERRSLRDPVWRNLVWLDRSTSGSWTDTALPSNDRCEYRVRTWNTSGYSAYTSAAGSVVSTVAAPTNVRASKQPSGNVFVEWDKAYPSGGTFTVFDNGDQVFEMPVGSAPFTFAHAASAQETHTYTVRHTDSGVSSPLSAPSNTVQLLAAPNAPKLVGPSGAAAVGQVRLQWVHNPVDSTPQQAAVVRYRTQGASSWITRTVTTASELIVAFQAGTFEWQVQTKGLHASYSPWSPLGVFQVVDAPGVTILTPANGETYTTSMLGVSWSYYQAQGADQAEAEIRVIAHYGTPEQVEIAVQTIPGGVSSWTMPTRLEDGVHYQVVVRAKSGHGIWSKPVAAVFPVSFPAPPQPDVRVRWDESTGAAQIMLANPEPFPASKKKTNYIFNPSRFTDTKNWWLRLSELDAIDGRLRLLSVGGKSVSVVTHLREVPAVSPGMWFSAGAHVTAHESAKVQVGAEFHTSANAFVQSLYSDMSSTSDLSLVGVVPEGDISRARLVIRAECEGGLFPALSGNTSNWNMGNALTFTPEKVMSAALGESATMDRRLLGRSVAAIDVTGRVGHKIRIRTQAMSTKNENTGVLAIGFYGLNNEGTYIKSLWNDGNGNTQDNTLPVGTTYQVYRNSVTITQDIIDAGVTQIVPCVYIPAGAGINSLTVVDEELSSVFVESAILQVGQTQEDVQDTTHFDGSMGPNLMHGGQSYALSWDGTPGASTSTATPNSPATIANTVERSIDGGKTWETVADKLAISSSITDPECLSNGTTLYRVTAISDLPSSSSTTIELTTSSDAIWLSGGQGFALAVPLAWNPKTAVSSGLANRKVHRFAGRRLPVEMSGVQRVRSVSLSATLLDERIDLLDRLEDLSYRPAPFLYRDPLGRRIYTSLSGLQMDRAVGGTWSVSASLEEVDR